jgi:hypothetical protein
MSKFEEYWIGKGIDLDEVWADFDKGQSYIRKFESRRVHLMTLIFNSNGSAPLYNHEAIFKTVKFYFHELKLHCLTSREYDESAPLFLYDVERGSSWYEFAGDIGNLVLTALSLTDQSRIAKSNLLTKEVERFQRQLEVARKFGVNQGELSRAWKEWLKADTQDALRDARNRLVDAGLKEILISEKPLEGNPGVAKSSLLTVGHIDRRA